MYNATILKIDIINCDTEDVTKAYLFALSMTNKSITTGNISVFENFIIGQLRLDKDNLHFEVLLTLCWSDLKTEI